MATSGGAPSAARRLILVSAAALSLLPGAEAFGEAQKYLIVSSPRKSRIAYLTLPESGAPATGGDTLRVLTSEGLKFPQGLAVDQYRKRLFVADPNLGYLAGYDLHHDRYGGLRVSKMWTAAKNVEVRSVAVDGLGNVFFADEPKQLIMRLSAEQLDKGDTTAEVVYDSSKMPEVSAPGGIAVDNYFVYWLNKANGDQAGTVIRAPQDPALFMPTAAAVSSYTGNSSVPVPVPASPSTAPESGLSAVALASNAVKCYGICIGLGHIFYTDEAKNIYGIPRAATARHNPVTISSALAEPRGCAFDGDSTVYVADKDRHKVYQFASNMPKLTPGRPLSVAADVEGAYGVAVYVKIMD